MKKTNFTNTLAITLTFLAITFISMKFDTIFYSFHSSEDIFKNEYIDIDELDTGGHIKTQIQYLFGGMEIENNLWLDIGPTLYSDYYYYAPISGTDGNIYFICVEGDSDDTEMYEKLITNTWLYAETFDTAYLNNPIDFEGTISKIDNEVYDEIKLHIKEIGFYSSNSDIEKYVLPYVLEPVNFSMAPIYFIVLIILVVGTIVAWIAYLKAKAQEKLDRQRSIQASYEASYSNSYNSTYNNSYDNSYNNTYNNSYNNSYDYIPSSSPSNGTYSSYSTPTVPNNEPTISINGVPCAISALDTIDSYICTNQDAMAIQELRRITGFSEDQAKEIVDNWFMYYK